MAPTPAFLPGESYGQRSLAGCSPCSHKESDTAEATDHTLGCVGCLIILICHFEKDT